MSWKEFKREMLDDPEIRKEYEKLEPEYKLISQIIDLRTKKKISQRELAKRMNTKHPSIARFESGESNPTLAYLKKMADALDAELDIKFRPRAV